MLHNILSFLVLLVVFHYDVVVSSFSVRTPERKELSKNSYILRRKKEVNNTELSVPSSEVLLGIVKENSVKVRGSKKYIAAWSNWLQLTIGAIRYHLSQILPDPINEDGFQELWFQLGVAADRGEMPSFADGGSRSAYALEFFCRSRLLADILMDLDNPTLPMRWKDVVMKKRLLESIGGERATCCNLTSLGGGPGYDFVAAAMVAMHNSGGGSTAKVSGTILDYEEGWEELVESMDRAVGTALNHQDSFACRWGGKCDITKALGDPINAPCLDKINTTDLWTCQYCVAENVNQLRESKYVFFRDLFHRVPNGTLFIFTETTPRVWPDFFDLIQEDESLRNRFEITFPYVYGRGPKGCQMALVKVDNNDKPCAIRKKDRELLEWFRRMAELQKRNLVNGKKRQTKKIRGSKL